MTIVEFLTARLDEDEAAALAAPGRQWNAFKQDDVAGASVYDEQWVLLYPEHYDHDKPLSNKPGATGPMYVERSRDELCAHIARHDPGRILADIAAKRRIIEAYREEHELSREPALRNVNVPEELQALEFAVKCLALPYSDHPDYQEDWRP